MARPSPTQARALRYLVHGEPTPLSISTQATRRALVRHGWAEERGLSVYGKTRYVITDAGRQALAEWEAAR